MKIGLGFMRHERNQQDGQDLVDYAINNNNNYFEVSTFYMNFYCEKYLYKLLKKYTRYDYNICQKMPIKNVIPKNDFKTIYYNQLKSVPGNYFDTYLLQSLSHESLYSLYETEIIPFFLEEKRKVNILQFGFSNKSNNIALNQFLKLNCWDIIQLPIDYITWRFYEGEKNYKDVQKYNIPIVAQAPLKGGELPPFEAINFLKQIPNISLGLFGTTKLEHYKQILEIFKQPIKDIDYNKLQFEFIQKNYINCLNCNRCFYECKENVPILSLFNLYNNVLLEQENAYTMLTFLKNNGNILSCQKCKEYNCEKVCPAQIPIATTLQNLYLQGV